MGKKILVFALIFVFVFMLSWNAGMFLPPGYKAWKGMRKASPFYYYEENRGYSDKYSNTVFLIRYQVNKPYLEGLFYFDNNDKQYRIQSDAKTFTQPNIGIYNQADDFLIGTFLIRKKDWHYECNQEYSFIFLDDNYIYYSSITSITRFSFGIPNGHSSGTTYSKCEFYKFDLNTGKNQKVSIKLFMEKINKYDATIKRK